MKRLIDFHIHYTPEDMVRPNLQEHGSKFVFMQEGIPSYTHHERLYRIDRHVACMNEAGVDLAVLSSGAGMGAGHEACAHVNEELARLATEYPTRFYPLAHIDPKDDRWRQELKKCVAQYGFGGVAFPSSFGDVNLDDPLLYPVFEEIAGAGLFVFVHPSLSVPTGLGRFYDRYDLYRCVGREHDLVLATYRLIAGRVFDRFPGLRVVMSHLGGGIAAILHRIRGYQDKGHMGLPTDSPHALVADHSFDYYIANNLFFDTGGVFGSVNAIRAALTEIPAERLVFGTDYPQEIRDAETMARFVRDLRAAELTPPVIDGILGGNGSDLVRTAGRTGQQ